MSGIRSGYRGSLWLLGGHNRGTRGLEGGSGHRALGIGELGRVVGFLYKADALSADAVSVHSLLAVAAAQDDTGPGVVGPNALAGVDTAHPGHDDIEDIEIYSVALAPMEFECLHSVDGREHAVSRLP